MTKRSDFFNMELLCGTLSAMALFLCGAFVTRWAACARTPDEEGETDAPFDGVPPAPSAYEDDLRALMRYVPGEQEERHEI